VIGSLSTYFAGNSDMVFYSFPAPVTTGLTRNLPGQAGQPLFPGGIAYFDIPAVYWSRITSNHSLRQKRAPLLEPPVPPLRLDRHHGTTRK